MHDFSNIILFCMGHILETDGRDMTGTSRGCIRYVLVVPGPPYMHGRWLLLRLSAHVQDHIWTISNENW